MNNNLDAKISWGLSEEEAAERLRTEGYNELPTTKNRTLLNIALEVIREPMILLLVAAGSIYLLLGDATEALLLLGFIFIIIGITVYQEQKTERVLEALRDLTSPRALVIRDGEKKRISGREVVREDTIILSEGDRVSADAVVLSSSSLQIDESLLTGESIAVNKIKWDGISTITHPGGDNLPYVYSGTMVVRGQGIGRVLSTGVHTEIGKIGKSLQSIEQDKSPLQKETGNIVRILAIEGFLLAAVVVVLYGLSRGNWLEAFLAGITLAMSMIPQEFPIILTVFMALGAWRISRNQVLTRKVSAIETLGSATVLCVDKTGTLTLNKMMVEQLFINGEFHNIDLKNKELPEKFHQLLEFSILASDIEPFDPMEKAIKELGEHYLAHTEYIHTNWKLEKEYPLTPELLAISHIWKGSNDNKYIVAAKGAPEDIAELCHMGESERKKLTTEINSMAGEGLRVLGIARALFNQEKELPKSQHEFNFEFIGLVGLADPIRPAVPQAIKECHEAGIKVVMITGDYPGTAKAIAKQAGLDHSRVITGDEINELSDDELKKIIEEANIFARVVPEQKLRIVNGYKANGEVVAMTGDGVNDAPALKSAHIGIAMGGRGTDVAREASSLVLMDDAFESIVHAVKLGRRIFDNLKKAMAYVLAMHVPIAGLALIPLIFGFPLIFSPIHIVFLELIINPACSIVFEAENEENDIMERPPRTQDEKLFNMRTVVLSLLQGTSILIVALIVFISSIYLGQSGAESRTMAFFTLIIANLSLILTNRSWTRTIWETLSSPNTALWRVIGGALILLMLTIYQPFLMDAFRFAPLSVYEIAICFIAGFSSILWFEIFKVFNKHKNGHN